VSHYIKFIFTVCAQKMTRENTKVLIVDDEEDICFFLSHSLTKRGFTTFFSNTLSDAIKQLEINQPEILFLDNHLPDGKGIELMDEIKGLYPDLKTIMISAHDSPQDRSNAYNNGIKFFISKPFSMNEINRVVDLVTEEL
jgi:two-component system OmpR family response regulator